MLTGMAYEHRPSRTVRIQRALLVDAIHQAFVESRYAEPPQPRYVNIHANGNVFISRLGLHVTHEGFSLLSVRCFASPDLPANAMPTGAPWTREEFAAWVSSRNDLYLDPTMEDLTGQADRKGLRINLLGP